MCAGLRDDKLVMRFPADAAPKGLEAGMMVRACVAQSVALNVGMGSMCTAMPSPSGTVAGMVISEL